MESTLEARELTSNGVKNLEGTNLQIIKIFKQIIHIIKMKYLLVKRLKFKLFELNFSTIQILNIFIIKKNNNLIIFWLQSYFLNLLN